ncbi:MAG: superoxide dismutase family protein [Ginsengibacter sp.]
MKSLIQSFKLTAFVLINLFSMAACNTGTKTTSSTDSTMLANNQNNMPDTMQNAMKSQDTMKHQHAAAVLSGVNADTTVTGNVQFDAQADGKVKMRLEISVPKKAGSSVAVHIHDMGDCGSMGDMAKAAGGHWNPTNAQHGKWGGSSFHSGDIGNVQLDAKGNGSMELETDLWSLGGDAKANILAKSIIVHSGIDDFTTQPSGNSGSRIGCGVIK